MTDTNTNRNVSTREPHPRVPERIGTVIEFYLRAADRLATLIWAIALIMATVMTLIVITQVGTRYVLGYITTWGNELARYLMIWFAMLLAGVLVYEDNHLQVEILFQKLSARTARIVRSAELALVGGFGLVVAHYGYEWASTSGYYSTTPALESVTPFEFYMAYVYIVIPIGGVLVAFFAVAKTLEINYYPATIEDDYASRFIVEEDDADADTGSAETDTAEKPSEAPEDEPQ